MKRSRKEINAVIKQLLIKHGPISCHALAEMVGIPYKTMRRDLNMFRAAGFEFHIAGWFPMEPSVGCPCALLAYGQGVNVEQPWGVRQDSRERKSYNMAQALTVFESHEAVSTKLLRAELGVNRDAAWAYIKELESENKIHACGMDGNGVLYALGPAPEGCQQEFDDETDDEELFAAAKARAIKKTDDECRQMIARMSQYASPFSYLLAAVA